VCALRAERSGERQRGAHAMSGRAEHAPPVSVRLPRTLIAKVDALVELFNATEHGRTTRSMMLLELVRVGLRQMEKRS
jgi:hypothetical protein